MSEMKSNTMISNNNNNNIDNNNNINNSDENNNNNNSSNNNNNNNIQNGFMITNSSTQNSSNSSNNNKTSTSPFLIGNNNNNNNNNGILNSTMIPFSSTQLIQGSSPGSALPLFSEIGSPSSTSILNIPVNTKSLNKDTSVGARRRKHQQSKSQSYSNFSTDGTTLPAETDSHRREGDQRHTGARVGRYQRSLGNAARVRELEGADRRGDNRAGQARRATQRVERTTRATRAANRSDAGTSEEGARLECCAATRV
ncbi:hypothetical protein PPL_05325 [Heterostelium album PN500]|uniref:Uncharacterized protein n=1 Tax=Heterostelium pallidum (strain ATCC 26659 / Pp 5 / PN500) TaxID=670386 RepID=D3BBD5_HETP5|nr:hypothetical protein PPL_05325 [Heterostelium album PN500]EFA81342.1 hypothetical protein PPL_05325 [Heterostelium album PN500]|eukprot:XP_020433460.1 hypothetical protein PPL_05325 [Heterostelium album PN500]